HAVEAVVDPHARALDLDRLLEEVRQQRQRQEPVGDRRLVRGLARRALAIDVDPLVVEGRIGELVDVLLGHGEPLGHRDFLACPRLEPVYAAAYDLGHGGQYLIVTTLPPPVRLFLALGGVAALLAVALGAFGAHALKSRIAPEMLAVWHTGVEYHVFHALG